MSAVTELDLRRAWRARERALRTAERWRLELERMIVAAARTMSTAEIAAALEGGMTRQRVHQIIARARNDDERHKGARAG